MTARTYEIRTYGCQMNVHDSERLAGLLGEVETWDFMFGVVGEKLAPVVRSRA